MLPLTLPLPFPREDPCSYRGEQDFGNYTDLCSIGKKFPSHLIQLYPSYLQWAANKDSLITVTCKKHVDFNLSSIIVSISEKHFFRTSLKRPSFLGENAYEHIVRTQQALQERYTLLSGGQHHLAVSGFPRFAWFPASLGVSTRHLISHSLVELRSPGQTLLCGKQTSLGLLPTCLQWDQTCQTLSWYTLTCHSKATRAIPDDLGKGFHTMPNIKQKP